MELNGSYALPTGITEKGGVVQWAAPSTLNLTATGDRQPQCSQTHGL